MTIPTYDITIADKIKEYRMKNKLSMKDFGKLIGESAQAVCKWEQNVCCPDIETIFVKGKVCIFTKC